MAGADSRVRRGDTHEDSMISYPSRGYPYINALPDTVDAAVESSARNNTAPYRHLPVVPPDIDMSLPVRIPELWSGYTWPPERMTSRRNRLTVLYDVWRGDLSGVMDIREMYDSGVTPTNLARRTIGIMAQLIMREPPEHDDVSLVTAAHDMLVDLLRSGAAFCLRTTEGYRWIDSRYVWWTPDGEWVAAEPVQLDTRWQSVDQIDHLRVTVVSEGKGYMWYQPVGFTTTYTDHWFPASMPPSRVENIGMAAMGAAYMPPTQHRGGWGTSLLDDLIPIWVQLARARARDTEVIDEHSRPLLIFRGQVSPWQDRAPEAVSLAARESGHTQLPDEVTADTRTMRLLRRHGVLPFTDGSQYAEYLTWDGDLSASMQLQMRLDGDMRLMSGIAGILGSEQAIPSGMSLKRMFYVADASATSARLAVQRALETLTGAPLDWPDAFNQVDTDNREDVESEARADRGQMASGDDENNDATG